MCLILHTKLHIWVYFISHLKANPKYRQRLKWNRSWHGDAEGGCWKRPGKAAEGAAPVVSGHCFRTSQED